jgi:tRNA pseudouridine55 synthase
VATSDRRPSRAEIQAILPRFTGPIEQVPPAYSALKVDGKRAYDLARAGEQVVLKSRNVAVYGLAVTDSSPDAATLTASVSKGTYIRSLARDIAHALDTVGQVIMLHRIKAGPFTLDGAISLDKLAESSKARTLEEHLLPLTAGLDDIPALPVTPDQAGALRQGRKLIGIAAQPGLYLATDQDVPVALVELGEEGLRVVRGFNL